MRSKENGSSGNKRKGKLEGKRHGQEEKFAKFGLRHRQAAERGIGKM